MPKKKEKENILEERKRCVAYKKENGRGVIPSTFPNMRARKKHIQVASGDREARGKKIQRFWGENLERNVVIFFLLFCYLFSLTCCSTPVYRGFDTDARNEG